MNMPLSWLEEATQIKDENFAQKMTAAGNAIEGIEHKCAHITGVVIGRVENLQRHPDADKLWITTIDIGAPASYEAGTLTIVTGADNLQVGDIIPVATHGSTLANGLKIKRSKMRGVESNGMLVSVDELGYTRADFPEAPENGIYVFENLDLDRYPLGSCAKAPLLLDEIVIDFDILSNRADTMSIQGMAREIAAVYDAKYTQPPIVLKEDGHGMATDYVSVEIDDPARCPRYIARVVQDVKIGTSPLWMRRRLSESGVKPINNIVDISNYVMLEYGQPLHAFDIRAVAQDAAGRHAIRVRCATEGEEITTLDSILRTPDTTALLITDCQKPIAIAGIMGGESSKIVDDTSTILFESACFDMAGTRLTSRHLGLRTDAGARYEKGQDPNIALTAVNRAMELVEQLACGKVVPGMVDAYPSPRHPRTLSVDPRAISSLLGLCDDSLPPERIAEYLERVGLPTKLQFASPQEAREGEVMQIVVTIPTHRPDITRMACLAEEVARFYGLNNIPSRMTNEIRGEAALPAAGKSHARRLADRIRDIVLALGFTEAITFPFESPAVYDKLCCPDKTTFAIPIKNPLNTDMSLMRTIWSAPAGLLDCLERNFKRGNESALLYEIVHTYYVGDDGEIFEEEVLVLAGYAPGFEYPDMKGTIEELLTQLTNRPQEYSSLPTAAAYLHPGRAAAAHVRTSKNPRDAALGVAYFGEVHPATLQAYEIGTRAYVAVMGMDELAQAASSHSYKFVPPPVFPPLTRDLAFKVQDDIPAADIMAAIREKGGQLLTDVKLFDVYTGPQVGEGYKSVAYALKFRAERNLAAEDVATPLKNIEAHLESKFGAQVRTA
jgi:phenylalanyl-tRNA synthetase beta chain